MGDNKQQKPPRSRDGDALLQACEREGCPICLVTLERMERVMDFWQYEWASEWKNRQVLIHSKGFCSRHTWQLTQMTNVPAPFALAMVYRSVLPDVLEEIERDLEQVKGARGSGHKPFWKKLWRRKREQPEQADTAIFFSGCPFCQRQRETEQALLQELLLMLSFEEFQAKLRASTGFCLPHLTQIVRAAMNDAQRTILLDVQRACLQRNLGELDELVRKHDYRFLQEPRGDEMTAWRRAAELLVGNRGVR
ncbi:MAG TPA: DUF6062 family protein [Ktedonobacteraceae bacterium]